MICQLISIILTLAILSAIFYALWMAVLRVPGPFAWIARIIYWIAVALVLLEMLTSGFASAHLLHLVC